MPAQVKLPIGQRSFTDNVVDCGEELRLANDHIRELVQFTGGEIAGPGRGRIGSSERSHFEFVIVSVGVAQLDAGAAGFGQRGFDLEHQRGLGFRIGLTFPQQGKHLGDVQTIVAPLLGEVVF